MYFCRLTQQTIVFKGISLLTTGFHYCYLEDGCYSYCSFVGHLFCLQTLKSVFFYSKITVYFKVFFCHFLFLFFKIYPACDIGLPEPEKSSNLKEPLCLRVSHLFFTLSSSPSGTLTWHLVRLPHSELLFHMNHLFFFLTLCAAFWVILPICLPVHHCLQLVVCGLMHCISYFNYIFSFLKFLLFSDLLGYFGCSFIVLSVSPFNFL